MLTIRIEKDPSKTLKQEYKHLNIRDEQIAIKIDDTLREVIIDSKPFSIDNQTNRAVLTATHWKSDREFALLEFYEEKRLLIIRDHRQERDNETVLLKTTTERYRVQEQNEI